MNKRAVLTIANYSPVIVILLLSMMAQSFAVTLFEQTNMQGALLSVSEQLYWTIFAMGLCGVVLIVLNADKVGRLHKLNEDKKEAMVLLENRVAELQKAQNDKEALHEQLFQAQKLEAIGRLAGGIAHDFNNILAAMNGYAEFLMDDLDEETPQHKFAENILKAGVQAREIVDKMLTFSRQDNDESWHMDLKMPILETVSMLNASLPKTISVNLDIADEDIFINGNKTKIAQALMNLCVNAKDAIDENRGAISMELKAVSASDYTDIETQDSFLDSNDTPPVNFKDSDNDNHTRLVLGTLVAGQDYVCLTVSDTGSGMTRTVMEHIFEPFFTTKPVDKGTGLGLAMVHGVIIAHRAALVIDSTMHEGTSFQLLFPVADNDSKQRSLNVNIFQEHGSGKVLLVEDQSDVRLMMVTLLERLGFETEVCEDGAEALAVIRENPDYFDVILTDQNMPNMTGTELIQATAPVFPNIPFILLSGYSQEKIQNVMDENISVKAILKKPVKRDVLLQTLREVMASSRTQIKAA